MKQNSMWIARYRPRKIDDCVVSTQIKQIFRNIRDSGELMHMLLYSVSPGTGKTTMAKAICDELGCDYIVINGSDEGRLMDTIRVRIRQFASSLSMTSDKPKIVIIDEADGIPELNQKSLKAFIEEFEDNCRFIFTANYQHAIIDPIRSRLTPIEFKIPVEEKKDLLIEFTKRCCSILDENNIEYDKRFLIQFVSMNFPDFRRTLNGLQKYTSYNVKVDEGILMMLSSEMTAYLEALKNKDFTSARKWLVESNPSNQFYTELLNELYKKLDDTIAGIILIIAEYAYKHAFVADPQVNFAAMTVEIMAKARWK